MTTERTEHDMICTICSDRATHYYRSAGGDNVGRCQYHADQFGYPEYLVEINPAPKAVRLPAYVIQFADGQGEIDEIGAIWPFADDLAEFWVQAVAESSKENAEWVVADAAYAPYEPQYLESREVTVEVTRVTSLAILQCERP
ncbi:MULTISPECIES: hypothetical protein [unclassified Streptomyces]|uniref:hypothetical protein n=1 Tax=unclassified Streptomyces TaxID=2593676 RepID=UPI001B37EAB8|nr:hypothetical protein [Streptomyces sp. RK76]MBQ0949231.1 hypothetical protein [Streptomyces sp. RK76]